MKRGQTELLRLILMKSRESQQRSSYESFAKIGKRMDIVASRMETVASRRAQREKML